MEIENIKVGMNCHLTALDNQIFVVAEIVDKLFPIGIARLGETKAIYPCTASVS